MGLILLEIVLVMILRVALDKETGLHSVVEEWLFTSGIRQVNVWLCLDITIMVEDIEREINYVFAYNILIGVVEIGWKPIWSKGNHTFHLENRIPYLFSCKVLLKVIQYVTVNYVIHSFVDISKLVILINLNI